MTGGTKHKHSYLGRLAQDSLILSALNALQAKLGRALRRVPVRRPQSGAEGVFGALRRRAAVAKRTAVLKMKVASAVESSAAVRVYRGFVRTLLGLSMQTVAVFFITFGLYTLASSLIRLFTAGQPASPSELLPGVLSLLFAALFVGCGDSLQSKLRGSGLFRLVFVRLLGVDEQTLAGTASVRGYGAVAVIVGTLLGSLSYFVSAWRILLCLLSVLFALAVLRFPETGLLAALLLFPFLPAPGLAALLVVSFASYLLRLSRGKRNFRFAKPDGCFWFFAAASLLLLGGDTGASAALRLCCACAFPLCVNLLRSEKLLSRAAACLFVGLSAFAVLFCLTAWTPARAIWDALGLPVFAPTAAAAAVCLTALLPLCVQALLRAPARGRRLAALLLLAVDGCALVLLRSESVLYLALVVLTASFALSTGKALVSLLGMGLFSLAAVGFVRCAAALGAVAPASFFPERLLPDCPPAALLTGVGGGMGFCAVFGGTFPAVSGYFRLAAEGGLFYLLLPVSLAVLTVARAVPLLRGRNGPDKTAACGVGMLLAVALSAAVFDVFADSAAQLLFWASAGLLSAAAENGRAVGRQPEI